MEKLYKLPVNDDTIFHSEVYFINQTVQIGIKWGTDTKVRLFDPATGLHLELGTCGQFSLKVCDSRKLVVKLVGTASEFTHADVLDGGFGMKPTIAKFKAMIMTKVKSNLAQIIKNNQINVLELDENLDLISEKLRDAINPILSDYDLVMPEFYATAIMTPDDDPNFQRMRQQHADLFLKVREEQIRKAAAEASAERQIVEAQTAARMKIIGAQGEAKANKLKAEAEAVEMRMKGYTYQQETAQQVGLGAVENMGGLGGSSGLGDLAGLGVSLGAMGSVINMTKDAMKPIANGAAGLGSSVADAMQNTWDCNCGNKHIVGNFCNNCGVKRPAPVDTWDCTCGNKNIVGNFCNNCGAKRPEQQETWDCTCGNKGITGNFCNNCGKKKGE